MISIGRDVLPCGCTTEVDVENFINGTAVVIAERKLTCQLHVAALLESEWTARKTAHGRVWEVAEQMAERLRYAIDTGDGLEDDKAALAAYDSLKGETVAKPEEAE